tara:strand:- start:133 stop:465 length:333 start_codon:yes stop_codon:yes gene_type:complete
VNKSKTISKNDSWVWICIALCFFAIPRVIRTLQPDYFAKKYANELAENICSFKFKGFSLKESSNKSWEVLGEKYGRSKLKYSRLNIELFASTFKKKVAECGVNLPDPKIP